MVASTALFVSCFFILHHLLRRRLHFADHSSSLGSSVKLIILNHRDFILQPLAFALCVMPYFISGHLMTCSKADTHVVGKLRTIFVLLSDSAQGITFFTYVSPSKVYMQEFWDSSYLGRLLTYIKDRAHTGILRKISVYTVYHPTCPLQ